FSDKKTWPVTGPVRVTTANEQSGNSIPFRIADCNDGGPANSCAAGTQCCASGSCQASCAPAPRESAYGWLFSTSVLPEFPVVMENASCRVAPKPSQLQSPSPYKGEADACINAEVRVQFSTAMQMDSGTLNTAVELRDCGTGATAACTGGPVVGLQFKPRDCTDSPANTQCRILAFTPPATFTDGKPFFKESTWYEVRLLSDPAAAKGMHEPGASGRYLDGDFNRTQGGAYVYSFRTRAGKDPCGVSSILVDPSKTTITQDENDVDFTAVPTGVNCNSLQCTSKEPYSLSWVADTYLKIEAPLGIPPEDNYCVQPVLAKAETPLTTLAVHLTPTGTTLPKIGTSDVEVKFAVPHVTDVAPVAACTEACINADISAGFNVPMNPDTLGRQGNVELLKCRNSSCTAPFLPLGGVTRTVEAGPAESVNGVSTYKRVSITGTGKSANLEPGTFYRVRIKGDDSSTPAVEGVTGRTGAALGGLNDGTWYTWTFRTKDDNTACLASSSVVTPAAVTLLYVNQRQDLSVVPFGSPDACSAKGQRLLPTSFLWNWTLDAGNPVVGGFINGIGKPVTANPVGTQVDTTPVAAPGCTDRCLLRGSQDSVPQCGDGKVESQYEECDGPSATCTARCTFAGTTAPTCGNGILDSGENCETVGGVFPPGCKKPDTQVAGFANNAGCVKTGSSTAVNSVCGDGFVSDGEACDDGNTAGGDGCSSDCLKEGTLPSCLGAAPGAACVNFCGNGKVEPGEDASCEPNPGAAGCDTHTCLKRGTDACPPGGGLACCGNGVVDPGETPSCELDPDGRKFCTARCTLNGSSAFYPQASFCGDGVTGEGEFGACEGTPDGQIDPYQVVNAVPGDSFNATTAAGSTATVRASTAGIAAGKEGSAQVSLSCTCGSLPASARDNFCSRFGTATGTDLACATSGCCAERPKISNVYPPEPSLGVCRNTKIEVSFDQVMDPAALQRSVLIGFDNGTSACPTGTQQIRLAADGSIAPQPGFFRRVADAIIGFIHEYVIRPVFGAGPGQPDTTHVFCALPASVQVTEQGSPKPTASVAEVFVKNALPANAWIVIRVMPDAVSTLGVSLSAGGARQYFQTGRELCSLDHVNVTPTSVLFSSPSDKPAPLTARAYAKNKWEIVSTPEYAWTWDWTKQASDKAETASPIVLEPRVVDNAAFSIADARVRGGKSGDAPAGFAPRSGKATAEASAILGSGASAKRFTGTAGVTVMLCENPWPARRMCPNANGSFTLPWDAAPDAECTPNAAFWYPFYDKATNVSFSYCRDTQTKGDSAALLPALHEAPAAVTPLAGSGILREYLFTFVAPAAGAAWSKDAIGLRINQNPLHLGAAAWYASKGFNGKPAPLTVDGFDAVRDGRTTYVDAGALPNQNGGSIFTNINILSYTDGAAPETTAIYDQILGGIDFMSRAGISHAPGGICTAPTGPISCTTDADCRVGASGAAVPGFSAYTCDVGRGMCKDAAGKDAPTAGTSVSCSADLDCRVSGGKFLTDDKGAALRTNVTCDAPKLKLNRDVQRWSGIASMRQTLVSAASNGSLPKLEAGTFLTTMSVSRWPSWADTLGSSVGALPHDPVDRFGLCATPGRDPLTCWNATDKTYFCPSDSHVYSYQYAQNPQGQDFRLRADFEFGSGSGNAFTWNGHTCIERTTALCQDDDGNGSVSPAEAASSVCAADGGSCNFRVGKVYIGGVNQAPNCGGTVLSEGNVCGDGRVGPNEVCEPGQTTSVQCDAAGGGKGLLAESCKADCSGWVPSGDGQCLAGSCGDGVVRGNEVCDDGRSLNGTYGHCAGDCKSFGFRCGDGNRQPNEKCDCSDQNGQYAFNGVTAAGDKYGVPNAPSCNVGDTGVNTCAWDCSGPGPRCGDGLVNGVNEVCDGNVETFKGFCSDANQTGCNVDGDCPSGSTCGNFCPTKEQKRTRTCKTNDPYSSADDSSACHWNAWICTAGGTCGNGIKETGEQCDDGNKIETDGCTSQCQLSTCGDGLVNAAAGEQCDDGQSNGTRCTAEYGKSCSYCSSSCKILSMSGGYCGDGVVQQSTSVPPGPEMCEGTGSVGHKYACISTRPEYQSYGLYMEEATCSSGTCAPTCKGKDEAVCLMKGALNDPNTNNDWVNGYPSSFVSSLGDGSTSASIINPFGTGTPPGELYDNCDPDDDNDG
ncbi:MAG: hypothetical protein RLZZ324_244, partial [Candidatus Parcubacteria bacterium]